MAEPIKNLVAISGMFVSGDLGPYTIYTNKNYKKVVYERSPPNKPPSPLQLIQRARFVQVAADWKALDQDTRDTWETCTIRTGIPLTGYNLFTFAETAHNSAQYLEAVFRQAKLLPVPPYIER